MLRFVLILVLVAVASCGTPPDVPPLTATGAAPALLPPGALPQAAAAPGAPGAPGAPQAPDLTARVARLRARAAALR